MNHGNVGSISLDESKYRTIGSALMGRRKMIDYSKLKMIPTDYDSPIKFHFVQQIATEIAKQTDEAVMKAVMNTGIKNNKKKLVEALQQDKERYDAAYQRGYFKGYHKREEEIVRCNDCENFDKDDLYCNKFGIQNIDGYWFCADGERKSD